jgi:hypothetical protein
MGERCWKIACSLVGRRKYIGDCDYEDSFFGRRYNKMF